MTCGELSRGGRIEGADPKHLSPRALTRGTEQVGSLGAGNHFIEIDLVELTQAKVVEIC